MNPVQIKSYVSRVCQMRTGMLIPLAFMLVSVVSGCHSYCVARHDITDDLNTAVIAMAKEKSLMLTRGDTVAALHRVQQLTHGPLIYKVSGVNFRNPVLNDSAYIALALLDKSDGGDAPVVRSCKIVTDSIMLMPDNARDGLSIRMQGFAECSVASVLMASDLTFSALFFLFSILTMVGMFVWRAKAVGNSDAGRFMTFDEVSSVAGIRLTPMQRRFAQLLFDAPGRKVDKSTLCFILWDGKSNAEESLYTLVRRTKKALAGSGVEIICNRGESYELHVNF